MVDSTYLVVHRALYHLPRILSRRWCCPTQIVIRVRVNHFTRYRVPYLADASPSSTKINTPHHSQDHTDTAHRTTHNATIYRPPKAKRCRTVILTSIRHSCRITPLQRRTNPHPHHPSRRSTPRNTPTDCLPRPNKEIRPYNHRYRSSKTRNLHRSKLRLKMARRSGRRCFGICGAEM